jgi:hypothetical protein
MSPGKSHFDANKPTNAPIKNDPVTLMIRMPQGNFIPKTLADATATRYLTIDPIAPPNPTAMMD